VKKEPSVDCTRSFDAIYPTDCGETVSGLWVPQV
jgi:hypothetical protein